MEKDTIKALRENDLFWDDMSPKMRAVARSIGYANFYRFGFGQWRFVGSGHDFEGHEKYRLPENWTE